MWKVVFLAVMMAMAVASAERHRGGPGGRFLVEHDHELSGASGRRLLNGNLCGRGYAPNYSCRSLLPRWAKHPACCSVRGIRQCLDIGDHNASHCGACNYRCGFRRECCGGKCVDTQRDRNNCGRCGNRCRHNLPCQQGQCGYNGRDHH